MFSGIIEDLGTVESIRPAGSNLQLRINCPFSAELKVDQSVAHNGVCLTVENIDGNTYQVTAIRETLDKSNLGQLRNGAPVNLERSLTVDARIDGHMVQGHVDGIGKCLKIEESDGSWVYTFSYPEEKAGLIVEKGSICVNGVSLTAFEVRQDRFSVAIIPYTFDHTNFGTLADGDEVNLEFDIIGKYLINWAQNYRDVLP